MKTILTILAFCMAGLSMAAIADEPTAPVTAAPAPIAKPTALRRAVAPTVSTTRVQRMPDGTLRAECIDAPNPRAQVLIDATRSNQPKVDAQ